MYRPATPTGYDPVSPVGHHVRHVLVGYVPQQPHGHIPQGVVTLNGIRGHLVARQVPAIVPQMPLPINHWDWQMQDPLAQQQPAIVPRMPLPINHWDWQMQAHLAQQLPNPAPHPPPAQQQPNPAPHPPPAQQQPNPAPHPPPAQQQPAKNPGVIDLTGKVVVDLTGDDSTPPTNAVKAPSNSVPPPHFDEAEKAIFKERLSYLKEWVRDTLNTPRETNWVKQADQAQAGRGRTYKHFRQWCLRYWKTNEEAKEHIRMICCLYDKFEEAYLQLFLYEHKWTPAEVEQANAARLLTAEGNRKGGNKRATPEDDDETMSTQPRKRTKSSNSSTRARKQKGAKSSKALTPVATPHATPEASLPSPRATPEGDDQTISTPPRKRTKSSSSSTQPRRTKSSKSSTRPRKQKGAKSSNALTPVAIPRATPEAPLQAEAATTDNDKELEEELIRGLAEEDSDLDEAATTDNDKELEEALIRGLAEEDSDLDEGRDALMEGDEQRRARGLGGGEEEDEEEEEEDGQARVSSGLHFEDGDTGITGDNFEEFEAAVAAARNPRQREEERLLRKCWGLL